METRNPGLAVHRQGTVGFTRIFTPVYPHDGEEPDKKPYIIFELPATYENKDYINEKTYSNLGLLNINKSNTSMTITITGDRKVSRAIKLFTREKTTYPEVHNQDLLTHLEEYKKECDQIFEEKPIKPVPPESKKFDFSRTRDQVSTRDRILEVQDNKNQRYIFKQYPHSRSITELEAFNAECHCLLLGNRHPTVNPIHDDEGRRKGLISKKINFKAFSKFENKPLSKDYLVKSELVKVLMTAIFEGNNDLNISNYGEGEEGYIVSIDDGQATWELTSKYEGVHPDKGLAHTAAHVPPAQAFPITAKDIKEFPYLTHAQPRVWITQPRKLSTDEKIHLFENLRAASQEQKFINDKFYIALKRILIPDEAYQEIGSDMIRSPHKRKAFVDHKCQKTQDIKNEFLTMPEFKKYLSEHHEKAIEQILSECKENKYLQNNLEQIQKNFNEVKDSLGIKPTSFFSRNPWVRDILIGAVIGLVAVGLILSVVAITAATHGVGTIPYLLGVGKGAAIIGTALSGGTLAAGSTGAVAAGLGAIAGGIVLVVTTFSGAVGAIVRKVFGNTSNKTEKAPEPTQLKNPSPNESPIIIASNSISKPKSIPQPKFNQRPQTQNTSSFSGAQFAQKVDQKDLDDINSLVSFLKEKRAFFLAKFKPDEFASWVTQKKNLKKANSDLSTNLKDAISEDPPSFKTAMNELEKGNEKLIRDLLLKNTQLRDALKNHRGNPVITAWYKDHPQKEVQQTLSR